MNVRVLTPAMAVLCLVVSPSAGCLSRPVVAIDPTLKTNFTAQVQETAVTKVDLLFMIDNSASMGDKQAYLQAAIPNLIGRLVTPNCVDPQNPGTVYGSSTTSGTKDGICAQGQVEFPPVHDLHLGIISSSLGTRGGDLCDPSAPPLAPYSNISAHNDDQGHLLDRSLTITGTPASPTASEGTVADASSGFLYWFPQVTENGSSTPGAGTPLTDPKQLQSDFESIVTGVGFFGCGIESQLESWYRFLVQPDPYDDIKVVPNGNNTQAVWDGVDATLLKQRHDFLRPDSLVAIITLTDENDSEIDVRALSGTAYKFMLRGYVPPRATTPCATSPGDPGCTSCDFLANPASDPACAVPWATPDWGTDANLRHVHMKQKYGVDIQFPIRRYVNGLTSQKVPDRTGEYPDLNQPYAGTNDCQNPLFAASLPDGSATDAQTLCNLPAGARPASFVFFAHIGGVPNQLLHFDPNSAQNSLLTSADWVKILGNNPEKYDYTGIDPHMIESYQPRPGVSSTPPAPGQPNPDPINGYDWTTNQGDGHVLSIDVEYACTFPLTQARDCTLPGNSNACDCPSAPTLTGDQIPPVCDPANQTSQVAAKAYPTVRELLLANQLGKQGIVSSICPIKVDDTDPTDPEYGYNPAIAVLIDRLKTALVSQCLPQELTPASDGSVPCLILATLPQSGATCDPNLGLSTPDPSVLASFHPDPPNGTVCEVQQLLGPQLVDGSCKESTTPGWCYVTGTAAGQCSQAILFGGGAPPAGAQITLQCIEANTTGDGG